MFTTLIFKQYKYLAFNIKCEVSAVSKRAYISKTRSWVLAYGLVHIKVVCNNTHEILPTKLEYLKSTSCWKSPNKYKKYSDSLITVTISILKHLQLYQNHSIIIQNPCVLISLLIKRHYHIPPPATHHDTTLAVSTVYDGEHQCSNHKCYCQVTQYVGFINLSRDISC